MRSQYKRPINYQSTPCNNIGVAPSNAPYQQLYNLLYKNSEQAKLEWFNNSSAESKQRIQAQQKFSINLEYYPIDLMNPKKSKGTSKGSNKKQRNTLLESLNQKIRTAFTSEAKKSYLTEKTNVKLKSLIFGRKTAAIGDKASGLQSREDKLKSDKKEESSPQSKVGYRVISESTQNVNYKKMMNVSQQVLTQQVSETDLEGSEMQIRKELPKRSLKLREPDFFVKRQKLHHKFIVNGSKIAENNTEVNHLQLQRVQPKHATKMQAYTPGIYRCRLTNDKNNTDFALSYGVVETVLTPPPKKLTRKTSFQRSQQQSPPEMLVSQHTLWKLQKMFQFYFLVLLSFGCKINSLVPQKFEKYSRREIELTYYVGNGNNRNLIVEVMNRRWWWKQVNRWQDATFVWTQHKIQTIFHRQAELSNKQLQPLELKKKDKNIEMMKKKWIECSSNQNLRCIFRQAVDESIIQSRNFKVMELPKLVHNHLMGGNILGDKKHLLRMLKMWMVEYQQANQSVLHSFIPQTQNIRSIQSTVMNEFRTKFNSNTHKDHNLWIVKPGQNSNRGKGIFISSSLPQIQHAIAQRSEMKGTTIVQKYITNLLLYQGRKFDIRAYLLCIIIEGVCKFYWYPQGYIRTSSQSFNLKEFDNMIHLTNDAVQSQGQQYGKFQKGNKISYSQLQRYLSQNFGHKNWMMSSLISKMKDIATKVSSASYPLIDLNKKSAGFELFGMDFIVDSNFTPWLLQVNVNPCLQLSSPLLEKLIPKMIQNVFRLTIDPLLPPSMFPTRQFEYNLSEKMIEGNKFQLIFDSLIERDANWQTYVAQCWPQGNLPEQQEIAIEK